MVKKRVCDVCGVDVLSPKGVKSYKEYENHEQIDYPSLVPGCGESTMFVHFCVNFAKGGDMCEACAIKNIKKAARKL